MTSRNQSTPTTARSAPRVVFLLKGNAAFVRLVTVVMGPLEGYECRIVDRDDIEAAAASQRPAAVILIEDSFFYAQLRSMPCLVGIPILWVAVSETDSTRQPALAHPDQGWVLRNDSVALGEILNRLTAEVVHKRILCIDDSPTVIRQIIKTFTGTPYVVVTGTNGREGLDILQSNRIDLIITDVEMPIMDGLEFCRRVRNIPESAETPIIVVSSRMDYQTISQGFEMGADEYLTKPFFPDELLNKVESYLVPPPSRRKEHILVISPQSMVQHQLRTSLGKQGFEVSVASDAKQALRYMGELTPDMIIAETELGNTSGFEFCAQARSRPEYRHVPFVIMTERTSTGARKMGVKVGVSSYLTKPFTREGVVSLVERLLAERRSLRALEWDMVLASITSLARALDERDPYTRFHSENVSRFAQAIGRRAGLNAVELENLRLAGLLHDIGKIGIPDSVLHKPDRLSEEEFAKIKEHSRRGAEILQPIPSLEQVIPAILHHHERIDGLGYPDGLKGDSIPVMAKILAVADTFDALTTDRPYRRGMPRDKAFQILNEAAGDQLQPQYVRILIEWLDESD